MQIAAGLHQSGRLAEAAEVYRKALADEPDNFSAYYALGIVFLQLGKFEEAENSVARSLALNARNTDGWHVRSAAKFRLGRMDEALGCIDQALALVPNGPEALAHRVLILSELGRLGEAVETLDRLLTLTPQDANRWNLRGSLLAMMGRLDEALANFDHALAIAPRLLEALANRATMLHDLKRYDDALTAIDAALAIAPNYAACWNNRGNTLLAISRYAEAVESYDKALSLDPSLTQAIHNRDLSLLELKNATRCPPGYISDLFDRFSEDYDRKMLETLGYRAHLHLRTLASRVLPHMKLPQRILDLGTGTGLVGDVFKDLAAGGRLDGIDLAPLMIDASRARGIYDDLVLGDLETILHQPGLHYDLVLAADTMIYFGDLLSTLTGVRKRLVGGGFYVFAVEAKAGEGWEHTNTNRFRHSENYLRAAAQEAGLHFVDIMTCVLRHEGNEPVPGFVVAVQKPFS